MTTQSRRSFLKVAGGTSLCSFGDFSFLNGLAPLSAGEAKLDPNVVRFDDSIEPVVRLLEETPRERLLEKVGERIRNGLSYREVLAALLLAGVRNIQPRPSVGFKFHAVLVVNSAHLASLSSPDSDRWLPIFWALDEFKDSQARDVREGNWTMSPVHEVEIPKAHQAAERFSAAMNTWNEPGADAAIAALARNAGANELFELLVRFSVRDFRSIGHKAIYLANSWRTLQSIGWQHAEPVLRSLTYALLNHTGEPNPAENDLAPDAAWKRNQELVKKIPATWQNGKLDDKATRELLQVLYSGTDIESCDAVVAMLQKGVSPQSIYDALLVGAGELLMRQPGIVGLHSVTCTNAMRYLFSTSQNEETRKLILLQNAAFLPLFRKAMQGRGRISEGRILELEAKEVTQKNGLQEIFTDVSGNRMEAARKTLAYLNADGNPKEYIDAARQLIFLKGTNAHDYKFSSAVLEDFYNVSPTWRNSFLATSVFNLRGAKDRENSLVERTRTALKG